MFIEERLLDCVAYGSQFGMEFRTRIREIRSGHERRTAEWVRPRGRYAVLYNALKPADHAQVRGAHMACMGALIGFRFKDWTDYTAEAEPLGTASGAQQTFPLIKRYQFGPLTFERRVFKAVQGTVTIYAGGIPVAASVNHNTGMVTVTANPGDPITWDGEFDIPVRFVSDRLDMEPRARVGDGHLLGADVELMEILV